MCVCTDARQIARILRSLPALSLSATDRGVCVPCLYVVMCGIRPSTLIPPPKALYPCLSHAYASKYKK